MCTFKSIVKFTIEVQGTMFLIIPPGNVSFFLHTHVMLLWDPTIGYQRVASFLWPNMFCGMFLIYEVHLCHIHGTSSIFYCCISFRWDRLAIVLWVFPCVCMVILPPCRFLWPQLLVMPPSPWGFTFTLAVLEYDTPALLVALSSFHFWSSVQWIQNPVLSSTTQNPQRRLEFLHVWHFRHCSILPFTAFWLSYYWSRYDSWKRSLQWTHVH